MKEQIAAGGSPSGDPDRERDFVIDVRNAEGVLTARYTLYGVPDLKLAYDLPVTLLTTEDATLIIKGINNTYPYDEVSPEVVFPASEDGHPTPEVFIEISPDIQGPEENIPAAVRQANIINQRRVEDAEIHE